MQDYSNSTDPLPVFGSLFWTERHPWEGTQHCLRDCERTCINDHTGCWWNNGHNECGHPSRFPQTFDSPLLKKDQP